MAKKILFTVMSVVLCLGLIGSAFAYFSDVERSEDNTFTAGTIDLDITGQSSITLIDMKPGATASGNITVKNIGNNAGCLYATSWYVDKDKLIGGVDADLVETFEFAAINYDAGTNPLALDMTADAVAKKLLITEFKVDGVAMSLTIPGFIPDTDGDTRITVFDMVNDASGGPLAGYPVSPGQLTTWYSYDANMTVGLSHTYALSVQFDPLAGNAYQADGIILTFEFLLTQK